MIINIINIRKIFKTFSNDIDKFSAKFGILRHSFNEWREAWSQRKSKIENLKAKGISPKEARQQTPSIFTSLGYGKAGLEAQIMKVPEELTDKQASRIVSTLDRIKNSGKDVAAETQRYISFLNSKGITGVGKYVEENDKLPSTMQGVQKAQKDARDAAIKHNQELQQLTISAKAASLGLKALSIAGSMALTMGISFLISKAIEGIDYLVNYEKKQEEAFNKAKESADSIAESIRNLKAEISDTTTKANELSSEYAELVQGVNPFTNENESLSNEKYERFLDLNKQLAELFPSLTKNYDENGNAILGLSGDVDSVTESIKRLVDQQNNLVKADMQNQLKEFVNGSDDADGFFSVIEGYKDKVSEKNNELKKLDKYYNAIIKGGKLEFNDSDNTDFLNIIEDKLGLSSDDIDKSIEAMSTGEALVRDFTSFGVKHFYDFSKLEPDDIDKNNITKSYDTFRKDLVKQKELTESELKTENDTMSSMMMTWVTDQYLYKDSNSEPFKKAIEAMVNDIQWSELNLEKDDLEGTKQFLQKSVLAPLSSACDDPDTKLNVINALNQLFTFDFSKLNYKEANEQIKTFLTTIMNAINKDLPDEQKKTLVDLYDMFNLGKYDEATVKMKTSLENLSHGNLDELQKLQDFTKGFTTAQTEAWLEAVMGAKNADQAIRKYNKTLEKENEKVDTHTKFSRKNWNEITNLPDDDANKTIKEAQSSIQELAEQGKLTIEAFNKIPGHTDILEYFGLEADEAVRKINKLIENTKQLDAMRTGITNITTNYDTKKEHKKLSSSDLSSTYDTLGISEWKGPDKKVWEEYKHAAEDTGIGLDEFKKKQDSLATSFVNSNNFLANLNNSNKDYYETILTEMGVTNAHEIVMETLNRAAERTKDAKEALNTSSQKVVDAFLDEKKSEEEAAETLKKIDSLSQDAAESLYDYYLAKVQAGQIKLDTSQEVNNLYKLALQAGIATSKIRELANASIQFGSAEDYQNQIDAINSGLNQSTGDKITYVDSHGNVKTTTRASAYNQISHLTTGKNKANQRAEKNIAKFNKKNKVDTVTNVNTTKGNKTNDSKDKKKKGSKGSGSTSTSQIDWIERRITRLTNRLEMAKTKYDALIATSKAKSTKSFVAQENKNLSNQIKLQGKLSKTYAKAAKKYDKQAEKLKIPKKYKNLVNNGGWTIENFVTSDSTKKGKTKKGKKKTKVSKNLYNSISKYIERKDKSDEMERNAISAKQARTEAKIQQKQNLADLYSSRTEMNSAQKENKQTAKDKKKEIKQQISDTKKSYKNQIKIAKLEKDSVKVSQLKAQLEKEIRDYKLEQHQNFQSEADARVALAQAQKENAVTAKDKNKYIDNEKAGLKSSYKEQIAQAELEYGKNSDQVKELKEKQKQEERNLDIEKHENFQQEYEDQIALLEADKENAKNAKDKNKILKSEVGFINKSYKEQIKIAELNGNITEQKRLQAELDKKLLDNEIEQHQNLAEEADATTALNEAREENAVGRKAKNAFVDAQETSVTESYKEQMKIAELNGDTTEYLRLQAEYESKINDLLQKRVDNVKKDYENYIGLLDHGEQDLKNALSLAEAKGSVIGRSFYDAQNKIEDTKLKTFYDERAELESRISNAVVGSQQWYDFQSDLQEIDNSINETKTSIVENNKSIAELTDTLNTAIDNYHKNLSDEADFLSGLLYGENFDSKTGTITDTGKQTLLLSGIQFETNKAGAGYWRKERERLETLFEQGKETGNWGIYNSEEELYRKIQDAIKSEQEWITNVKSSTDEIADITKEWLESEKEYLSDIIDARKNLLNEEKDLRDYERSISEKAKNVSTLEKQMRALNGNDSEEGMAKRAQLQVSLDEAKQDLEDTEYDKYISDQETMLDNLMSQYADIIENLEKDNQWLLNQGITYLNEHGTAIRELLNNNAEKWGYDYSNEFLEIVGAISENAFDPSLINGSETDSVFSRIQTGTDSILQYFKDKDARSAGITDKIVGDTNSIFEKVKEIAENTKTTANNTSATGNGNSDKGDASASETPAPTTGSSFSIVKPDGSIAPGQHVDSNIYYGGKSTGQLPSFTKEELKKKVKDNLTDKKYWDKATNEPDHLANKVIWRDGWLGGKKKKRKLNEKGRKKLIKLMGGITSTFDQVDLIFQNAGFKRGGIGRLVKKSGEDGIAMVRNGEGFVRPEDVGNIQDLLKIVPDMSNLIKINNLTPVQNIPKIQPMVENTVGDVHFNLELPNVNNYDEFVKAMQTDKRMQKCVDTLFDKKIGKAGSLAINRIR